MVVHGSLRRLGAGTLISAVGNGAWYTSWAIFLTRAVGLSPAAMGLGMTIAGACGVLAATPLGWVADRLGAREMFAGLLALCWAMLSTGLPLWVTLHTHAPRGISAVVVLISSFGIAVFQIRVSRGITHPRRAATGTVLSGCALAGSCLVFALTAGAGGP